MTVSLLQIVTIAQHLAFGVYWHSCINGVPSTLSTSHTHFQPMTFSVCMQTTFLAVKHKNVTTLLSNIHKSPHLLQAW
jgi:hypothetical protein